MSGNEEIRNPTNHDLHLMLVKLDGKVDQVLAAHTDIKERQINHEKHDRERFGSIYKVAVTACFAFVCSACKIIFFPEG